MTDWSTRLDLAGLGAELEPLIAWQRLREQEGPSVTVAQLYELVARARGVEVTDLTVTERHQLGQAAMTAIWPGFAVPPESSRRQDRIQLHEYDEAWPDRFSRWQRRITRALGLAARRIEHVGSTSVPGLTAKPIVDIQVSVTDLSDEASYVPGLQSLGLDLRLRDEQHRYFRPLPDRPRDVHVHVCATGSPWEDEHLLFRDYLRDHPAAREQYVNTKRIAADRWPDDGFAYTDAKTVVVLELLARAGQERSSRS